MQDEDHVIKFPLRRTVRRSIRRLLILLKSGGDVRSRKIRRIRAAVRGQHYDNDLKLSIALDRLLADEGR